MDRVEGPQTPYEVYCFNCRVTFALGTRRCVHCGAPIGRRSLHAATQLPVELPAAEEDMPVELSLGRRLGGISLWVLIALGAALSRMCSG